MNAQQIFDRARDNLFSAAKLMQDHGAAIVREMALDTGGARELDRLASGLQSLLDSMWNCSGSE